NHFRNPSHGSGNDGQSCPLGFQNGKGKSVMQGGQHHKIGLHHQGGYIFPSSQNTDHIGQSPLADFSSQLGFQHPVARQPTFKFYLVPFQPLQGLKQKGVSLDGHQTGGN